MPEGPDGKTIIIIKKVSGHGGHHGGAWKVAYADFVTAMMAFFMVLWLVNSASVITRERIASYFREPGVFEKGSGTPLEEGGAGILKDAFSPPADDNSRVTASQKIYKVDAQNGRLPDAFDTGEGAGEGEVKKEPRPLDPEDIDNIVKEIKKQMAAAAAANPKIKDILDHIEIKVDQRGLHIEIMDTDKASMFELGSSRINPDAEVALSKIAAVLGKLPNPIDIEGHTDSKPFHGGAEEQYDNWDLSSDRAHTARRILVAAGVPQKHIARVVGYADQRLKIPGDPLAASNRRISISMRFTELANKALEGTQTQTTESKPVSPINGGQAAAPAKERKAAEPPPHAPPVTSEAAEHPAAAAPPPSAAPQPAEHAQKGPAVSVGTTAPEGEPVTDEEHESGETWNQKDKIFGNKNPFFTQ